MDTETTGFKKHGGTNEPIQIVALYYKNGEEVKTFRYKKYFLPEQSITESAYKTHGLNMETLKEKGAVKLTPGQAMQLAHFFHVEKDLPIVAHYAKYNRDEVINPVFKRLKIP